MPLSRWSPLVWADQLGESGSHHFQPFLVAGIHGSAFVPERMGLMQRKSRTQDPQLRETRLGRNDSAGRAAELTVLMAA